MWDSVGVGVDVGGGELVADGTPRWHGVWHVACARWLAWKAPAPVVLLLYSCYCVWTSG